MNKLQKFMKGRYGVDEFYCFLFYLYIGLFMLHFFTRFRIFEILELLIIIFMFYRVFSKNIWRRKRENDYYLNWKSNLFKKIQDKKKIYQDRKYYIYKRCSKCRNILKLPLPFKRGIHHAKCPICQKRVTIWTFRKEKVVVIRQSKRKGEKEC